jgi:hypothetical protein
MRLSDEQILLRDTAPDVAQSLLVLRVRTWGMWSK